MKKILIEHAHYDQAVVQLRDAVSANYGPGRIVAICGLPGSGKTFMRNTVIAEVLGNPDSWGVGRLPAVEVMALQDKNTRFSAKGFAARSHRALLSPDLRGMLRHTDDSIYKDYVASLEAAENAWRNHKPSNNITEHEHWDGFIEMASHRKLKYFLVEHAASLAESARDEPPTGHMQNLMSVMEAIGGMAILNLVPNGYKLWEGRPEIADRMTKVFIQPYDITNEAQLEEFASLAVRIAERYDFDATMELRDIIVDVAIATGTCFRALERLFERAASRAKGERRRATSLDILASFPTRQHVDAVWKDIVLLKRISEPATSASLREVHKEFLKV